MSPYNNKNSSSTLRYAAIFLALLLPISSIAADKAAGTFDDEARWFQVELILFSHQTDLALDAEQWPDIKGLNLPEKLLELHMPESVVEEQLEPADDTAATEADPAEPRFEIAEGDGADMPVAYQILPSDQLQLTKMAEQLKRTANRELLLHIGWQQPTYDRKHAEPVYFVAGMNEPLPPVETKIEDKNSDENTIDSNQPTANEAMLLSTPEYATEEDRNIGPIDPRFVGTVTLSVERYLHVATDLIYRRAVTQHDATPIPDLDLWYDRPYPTLKEPQGPAFQQASWQAIRGFQHKESRRMRSTEIHYLDHPFIGMVVVITPVELPEPAEEIQQTSPQNILSTPSRTRISQ